MEAEVGEEGDVFRPLLALRKFGEDQESLPSPTLAKPNALQSSGQAVKIALSHPSPVHDPSRANVLESKIYEGKNNAHGEDPS